MIIAYFVSTICFFGVFCFAVKYGWYIDFLKWFHPLYAFVFFAVAVCIFVSTWRVANIAKRGGVLPYWWAIRFFKV